MTPEQLAERIKELEKGPVGKTVERRLKEFQRLGEKGTNEDWFSELSFCVLTANSSARLGIKIQKALGPQGFLKLPLDELTRELRRLGHRFYNMRARFIVRNRRFAKIRQMPMNNPREWLVANMRGIGYKEASHFLRNTGFLDVAILDRHILRQMVSHKLIKKSPKGLTRGRYMKLESVLRKFARKLGMQPGELDFYLWYLGTGEVLK